MEQKLTRNVVISFMLTSYCTEAGKAPAVTAQSEERSHSEVFNN